MTGARFEWNGDIAKRALRDAAHAGIGDGLEIVKNASLQVVPRETDRLAATAYVDVAPVAMIGAVGYDDPRDIKTIKQHEDLTYHHPAGESAKFLERPLRAQAGAALDALAAALSRRLS